MATEFKVVVEGELPRSTEHALTVAIQKAALLELARGDGVGDAMPDREIGFVFRTNIRGGKFILER